MYNCVFSLRRCVTVLWFICSYLSVKMFSLDAVKQQLLQHNDLIADDTSVGACCTRCRANMPSVFWGVCNLGPAKITMKSHKAHA